VILSIREFPHKKNITLKVILQNILGEIEINFTIPLKNLMMSVKSIWLAKIISLYVSTRARAKKSTK